MYFIFLHIDAHEIQDFQMKEKKWVIVPTSSQSKMDNPEKLATYGTQDEEKQNKNTTQYVLDTTISKQTQKCK